MGMARRGENISGGVERLDIAWPLVFMCLSFLWRVGEMPNDNCGTFVEVCRGRGLKVNAGKRKVMMLDREEGLECEVCVDIMRLDHV